MEVKYSPDNMGVNTNGDPLDCVNGFVTSAFPSAVKVEHFGHRIIYKVPSSDVKSLSKSFACLEEGQYIYTFVCLFISVLNVNRN